MYLRKLSYLFAILLLVFTFAPPVFAQEEEDDVLKADFVHFYDDLTMEKVSKLYWKLGKLDINNDGHVDNFLMINECDIYKDYYYNEFEWATVRQQAKIFLRDNREDFPVRFKYVQPLRLTEYDEATGMFGIHPDYQIKGYRKFEVLSSDFSEQVCTVKANTNIDYYPRIMLVELTQPLTLREIPVSPKRAQEYVKMKMESFNNLREANKTKENLYEFRDAYIVMKIKMFSYKGEHTIINGWMRAAVYGMLEGFEIYADPDHNTLLYFENYIREQDDTRPVNVRLKEQYEALRRKRGDVIEDEPQAEEQAEDALKEVVEEEPSNSLMDLKADPQ